jgi:hypothetical protein
MAEDLRLKDKPKTNPGDLPVMIYDYKEMPETTENIWHAQKAGWPIVLTYDGRFLLETGELESSSSRKRRINKKRRNNLDRVDAGSGGSFRIPTSKHVWRDEYPFASTVENNGSTWVGNCSADEQRAQRDLIKAFYRKHGAHMHHVLTGRPFWFEVRTVNMPRMDGRG